jgi:hypothetical protein
MWKQIHNKKGKVRKRSWSAFKKELRGEHQPIIMVEMLNTNMRPTGKVLRSPGVQIDQKGAFTNLVSDGSIDIDMERGIRRTAEITILNPTDEFTPATGNFRPEGPWVGELYLNRLVRIWRGVLVGSIEMYVPCGTFMIDESEVIVEQNMAMVNLTMSDMWKKLQKAYLGSPRRYVEGTTYNEIIRDLISGTGIKLTGRYGAVIDSLKDRDAEDRKIHHKLKYERGESRGDILKALGTRWGLDIYMDPLGAFRTEDRREESQRKIVWKLVSKEIGENGQNGGLVSISRKFNDDRVYNHVVVIGSGKKKGIVKATARDTNPNSKTAISKIGDRVLLKQSERISTQNEAGRMLRKLWRKRFTVADQLTCEAICNPALEADDVIKVVEKEHAKIRSRYRLRRLTVPLVTSRQTLEVQHIIKHDNIVFTQEGGGQPEG